MGKGLGLGEPGPGDVGLVTAQVRGPRSERSRTADSENPPASATGPNTLGWLAAGETGPRIQADSTGNPPRQSSTTCSGHLSHVYTPSCYFGSAHRNDPDIRIRELQRQGDPLDQVWINRTIENGAAVAQNYQRLAARTFGILDLDQPMMSDEFTESIIGPVRTPIAKLFPHLRLDGLANPMVDGAFRFTKGVSEGFHFKNLSGGEKAAFDLILDLVVAEDAYNDTSFCIDEPESHMNTRVQAELLSVLYELIPENCQLLLATHSIGMMCRAQEIAKNEEGSVVFLDFGSGDFAHPAVIRPTVPDRTFWNTAYEIALDDLAALVAPERVVICEGEPRQGNAGRNFSHDARCYQEIFEGAFPETEFVRHRG